MLTFPSDKALGHCLGGRRTPLIAHPDVPAANLAMIVSRCANLSASIRNPSITSVEIFAETQVLERELNDWEASLPESWEFTTAKVDSQLENTFNGITHV